jgi:putative DNA methylase
MGVVLEPRGRVGKVYMGEADIATELPGVGRENDILVQLNRRLHLGLPDKPLPPAGTLGFRIQRYGMKRWIDMLLPRQRATLGTFCEKILEARQLMASQCDAETASVITTYLMLVLGKLADMSSTSCILNYTGGRGLKPTVVRNALLMVWDFAEPNPFNVAAGGWTNQLEGVVQGILAAETTIGAKVTRGSADSLPFESLLM